MGQARTTLERMAALQRQFARASWALLAGDFNSVPGSGVHRFVAQGTLDCAGEDRRNMSGQLENEKTGWPARFSRSPQVRILSAQAAPPQLTLTESSRGCAMIARMLWDP